MPSTEYSNIFLESIIMGAIIVIELYLFVTTYRQSSEFKEIFKIQPQLRKEEIPLNQSSGEEDQALDNSASARDEVHLLSSSGNRIQTELISTINKYLINNRGATIDYHILKEIVNRKVETLENIIETRIPSPLYFGLAGTMLGIIIGLFKVDFEVASLDSIKPLIDGVKIAMIASVTGLILTSLLSIFVYKSAKEKMELGKNRFLSLIQTELLPSLIGQGQSGVVTLSTKLDDFGRKTVSTVNDLKSVVLNSQGQVKASQQLLKDIETIDLKNITGANLRVFKKLETLKDSLEAFPKYYQTLNESLTGTGNLLIALNKLISRTDRFDESLRLINTGAEQTNKAVNFFNTHIASFQEYSGAVNRAVAESQSSMEKAINTLELSAENLFTNFNSQLLTYDGQLQKGFELAIDKYNKTILELTDKTLNNLKEAQPQLQKLETLPEIRNELQTLNKTFENKIGILDRNLTLKMSEMVEVLKSAETLGESPALISAKTDSKGRKQIDLFLNATVKIVLLVAGLVIISFGVHSIIVFWNK